MDASAAHNPPGHKPNRLIQEKSPYLLQHAYNPVDWHPWGEEAFEAARREDKPVFLSIGYSTCHWCHVMERESFEDPATAAILNGAFINVKVDREERPDLDAVYMAACQMLSGQGGWPLTIIMTPGKKPFYAATYVPRETAFGRIGLSELAPRVKNLWQTERARVVAAADEIAVELARPPGICSGEAPHAADLDSAYLALMRAFDNQKGGFGVSPKFPTPHNLSFLLRYHQRTGDKPALHAVTRTLDAMRDGGIYDHAGFGFHRYSTDREWLAPHFEKMLYDQALLVIAYLEAYQVTRNERYADTAREVIAYVLRDLTSPEGAFYSAEDADSEGEEGKYYLWTAREFDEVLGHDAALARKVFNLTDEGNFEEANPANILHLAGPLPEGVTTEKLGHIISRLREARAKRVRPHLDDKVLADWNGLMIAALSRAASVLGEPAYAQAAEKAARFIREKMTGPDGRLFHRHRDGESAIPGFLEDYAFLVWGLIELYEAAFDPAHLKWAAELTRTMVARFSDEETGGFYQTASDAESTLMRPKDAYDGAVPSGNSVAMSNLLRLSRLIGEPDLERLAEKTMRAFYCQLKKAPAAYTFMMSAFDFALGPVSELVIVGRRGDRDAEEMLSAARSKFLPHSVIIFKDAREGDALAQVADYTRDLAEEGGRATAYVCRYQRCERPTHEVGTMLAALSENR